MKINILEEIKIIRVAKSVAILNDVIKDKNEHQPKMFP